MALRVHDSLARRTMGTGSNLNAPGADPTQAPLMPLPGCRGRQTVLAARRLVRVLRYASSLDLGT
jgi:hypothetical protein